VCLCACVCVRVCVRELLCVHVFVSLFHENAVRVRVCEIRIMSHIGRSCVTTFEWFVSPATLLFSSSNYMTFEWVMSQIWMSHVTHMNEPCRTFEWVMSHIWMSHVEHLNASVRRQHRRSPLPTTCDSKHMTWHIWMSHVNTLKWVTSHICMSDVTHEWVMSHIWIIHVTHLNESCHTYEWVISHIWMSHITHMNESCHTYEWVMSHIWTSHVTPLNDACRWLPGPSPLPTIKYVN